MNKETALKEVAKLLVASRKILFYTGAGVSTPSGIPDFRSPHGIWSKYDVNQYGTIEAFRSNPKKVWKFFIEVYSILKPAQPNKAHFSITNIQQLLGEEKVYVATQNIDFLHQKAGTKNVFEVHGTTKELECLWCQYEEPVEEERHLNTKPFPKCPKCNNPLKPKIILFGEYLPQREYSSASQIAKESDLLIAVGTSLEVFPAAYIYFDNRKARKVLLNLTQIQNMNQIDYFIQGNVVNTLPKLEEEVRKIIEKKN